MPYHRGFIKKSAIILSLGHQTTHTFLSIIVYISYAYLLTLPFTIIWHTLPCVLIVHWNCILAHSWTLSGVCFFHSCKVTLVAIISLLLQPPWALRCYYWVPYNFGIRASPSPLYCGLLSITLTHMLDSPFKSPYCSTIPSSLHCCCCSRQTPWLLSLRTDSSAKTSTLIMDCADSGMFTPGIF